jgi:alpha-tubulin suppressor-like RCC1 family protein
VSVGNHFGCVILENGDVKCWGRGYAGVLATGSTANLGDQPGEMGSNLKPLALGGPTAALQVGWQHVCALLTSGVMKCWGLGGAGQLGGRSSSFGDQATETAPPEVQLGPGLMVRELTLGQSHTCALTDAGLKCWGLNTNGQLGQDHANDLGKTAEEMGQALPLVPVSTPSDPVASVRAMNHATCASTRSGKLKCWGLAERGSLAQPSLTAAVGNIGDAQNEMSQLPPIDLGPDVSVRVFDVGATHGCVLLDTGEIKCWGNNDFGQLGLGHTHDIGISVGELGTMLQPTRVQ